MARTTPRIDREKLVLPDHHLPPIPIGSQQWYGWLRDEANTTFFFQDATGTFTARKERRKRGGWYWIAYRSREGKLTKTYLGRSEDLTLERLRTVSPLLAGQKQSPHPHAVQPHLLSTARPTPPLLPPHADHFLARTALLARLNECHNAKLTLLTAPAGFGKTTLLQLWYQQQSTSHTIAWLSLDERDNEPARFWNALWNTLLASAGGRIVDIATQLYTTPQMSLETVLAALLNGKHSGVLILDDYHLITHQQIHEGMQMLLSHLPSTLHLIIASRHEPPLALARIRMYGQLLELSAADLKLNLQETTRFLHDRTTVPLSPADIALLHQRTEGWIAGLHLAALALRGSQHPAWVLSHLHGGQHALFDYFAEEVLARQPQEIQHFLTSTALLPVLTASLCAWVLNIDAVDAQRLLRSLEQTQLFLFPQDEQRHSYRYHPLFREFLTTRLQQSAPEHLSRLHSRIADWYERERLSEEAIDYALAAGETARAHRLIEQVGEEILWKQGEVRRLLSWLHPLPATTSPSLHILYAWALLLSGQRHQREVEALLTSLERQPLSPELSGDIAALRARMAAFQNDRASVRLHSLQALQSLPPQRALLRADLLFGLSGTTRDLDEHYHLLTEALHLSQSMDSLRTAMFSSRYLAATCLDQGRLPEAEAILRQALQRTGGHTNYPAPAAGVIHVGLAELCYERNQLEAALHHALKGVELGEQSGEIKAVQTGYCILTQIWTARGEYELAQQQLWKAEDIATRGGVSWLRERTTACAVSLWLAHSDLAAAKRSLQQLGLAPETSSLEASNVDKAEAALLLAPIWLAEEKYSQLIALLQPVITAATQEKRTRSKLLAQTLQALALHGLQEREPAAHILQQVLLDAESAGYIRLFLDLGAPIQALLSKTKLTGRAYTYAHKLLAAFAQAETTNGIPQGLSAREHEVLQLLAAGLSNAEIAQTLVIALSTVKAHVRNLYQKLGVQKRTQAVAKAREAGFLS